MLTAATGCRLFKSCSDKQKQQIVELNATKSIAHTQNRERECGEHAMSQQHLTISLHEFDSIIHLHRSQTALRHWLK